MINIVRDLTRSFEVLNGLVEKKLIGKKTIGEMRVNIDDLVKIKYDLVRILSEINSFDLSDYDPDELEVVVFGLHSQMSSMKWHFGEIRDVMEIIMGRYRKLVREQGYAKD